MSGLEELRAMAAEEAEPVEVETPEVEPEIVEDENDTIEAEPEAEEAEDEEVDSIELTLDDEPKPTKYTPQQSLVHKLTKEKKKRQEATTELEELKAEIEALKKGQQVTAPVQPVKAPANSGYPPVPLLYENGVNTPAEYQQAYQNWTIECRNIDQRNAQQDTARVNASKETEARANRLAERSTSFIKENKIKADMAISTIQDGVQGLDGVLGVEGAALDLLDNIGDGSDKLAYYLGKNPDALATVKKLFEEDRRGFKVNTWLTKTALKLNRNNSKVSKAPEPDEALSGDGSTVTSGAWQKKYDDAKDISKMLEIKRQAKAAGVIVS